MRPFMLFLAALVGCAPSPTPPSDPTPELQALMAQSARAWNAGDLDGFLITYARDSATTFVTARGPIYGYEQIRGRYAARFEPGAERDSLTFAGFTVRMMGADYVLSTARYVLTRGDSVTATGPFTVIWERRPEGWRMVHDHTS
ncbi:MAG: nuclear transport factor 2 family protein [Gemmatimonadota bacterium]|nr:nuclear transport factor 2 family protein [Gemmatimonadota bacterium]MDH4349612.1 nuclear transport factor 2 family protein [Gemmatimonadota bacterium]